MSDDTNDELKERSRTMERHLQTIVAFVLAALLIWVGTSIQDMSVKLATLSVEVKNLQTQTHPVSIDKLIKIEGRLGAVEAEVRRLEREVADDG